MIYTDRPEWASAIIPEVRVMMLSTESLALKMVQKKVILSNPVLRFDNRKAGPGDI